MIISTVHILVESIFIKSLAYTHSWSMRSIEVAAQEHFIFSLLIEIQAFKEANDVLYMQKLDSF